MADAIQLTEVQVLRLKLAIQADELFKARLAKTVAEAQERLAKAFTDVGLDPQLVYALDTKAFTVTPVDPPVQV